MRRAREAAEALFRPKPQIIESVPEAPLPADPPVSPKEPVTREIPEAQFGRIRAWVKYGMTAAQVAELYGVPVAAIERVLRRG